jgi:hypothetical protein
MRPLLLRLGVAGLAVLAAACGSSPTTVTPPTGTVAFTAPAGGETFVIGDTAAVAWTCSSCANVPTGDYMQLYAYDGSASYLVANGAQLTDSIGWAVGTTLQNVSLLPGFYVMVLHDQAGYYSAQSRFIQLAAAP